MDWSNRFTLGGYTVTYCTFRGMWEVLENVRAMAHVKLPGVGLEPGNKLRLFVL